MGHVTVVGSFMYDLVATVPRRPRAGETLVGDSFGMFLGGKGANQAIAASRAGATVTMIGRLGNDLFGKQFLEKFSQEGINTDFVVQDKENGTGIGMPLIDSSGDNSIVIIPQANMALTVKNINQAEASIAKADVLVMQCEVPLEANQRAAEIAKENGTLVILNPAPAQLIPNHTLELVDIITPNETETEILTGLPTKTEDEVILAGKSLLSKGVKTVILTLGERGSMLLTKNGEKIIPAFDVNAVDTTAAGDSFCGALAASLADGKSINSSVEIANAAGALAVTILGAEPSLPHRDAIESLLQSN
ncbi:MAG: ribokinase [Candidatus Marinimicrobia bacterium]|jgi:ribokinase|nr:ribokinase [Candidatus Neomarinimicrobiota bacterium]MBT3501144.1 ribokinase [Candidatus Neomarinimicrobiota bacterium]MBT3840444.1 ribokinase [Candidatus Neomarinimicrobiota bacterium]MBT4000010.1 ribokinase [Candidatus Neomarinimicrobiota bacterium]MBT4282381.1 ribokinase [Candidatus Neomarinimicrobiota bacterium]